jgi:hypothetical protein
MLATENMFAEDVDLNQDGEISMDEWTENVQPAESHEHHDL